MNFFACLLLIIHLYLSKVDANDIATGCNKDMRLFGPNNHYRCNCEKLADCDFANNGKCRNAKCQNDYGGPFCQMKLHSRGLSQQISLDLNIFTKDIKQVKHNIQIPFNNKYNINKMTVTCNASKTRFSVYIGQKLFCDMPCSETVTCTGDITGGNMSIKSESDIAVSNMEMTGCSPFWFGVNCDKQCHCDQNNECHKITGHCPTGCESGRSGGDCQTLNYENVALNKRAEQTSTLYRDIILGDGTCKEQHFLFSANLAVDGNTDQQHERRSCMHTLHRNSYWRVDLGHNYHIKHIRIYNTDSANSDDLIGSVVYIGSNYCQILSKEIVKASTIIDISCLSVLQGTYVAIMGNDETLHFCEVEVLQCLPGFYGNRCSKSCPECKDSSCNQTDGTCHSGCAPGYKPKQSREICTADTSNVAQGDNIWNNQAVPSERTGCSPLWFGEDCDRQCHCDQNTECDKITGHCPAGCESGRSGLDCQILNHEITKGCGKNMRLFGPNDKYRCNCKELAFCDFSKNGKCKSGECESHYEGAFCQKICYHRYIEKYISPPQNVFKNDEIQISSHLNIPFRYKYRINSIIMICQSQVQAATISLYIDSERLCEVKCQNKPETKTCQGDAIGKYLIITTTTNISLSNMEVFGCSPLWFGVNCDKQCHCDQNTECHKITGHCPTGCESGRSGVDCQTLNYVNVALNKEASQSITVNSSTLLVNNTCIKIGFNFTAQLAVDGNTDQQIERRSCIYTKSNWTVDLGKQYNISQIRIYGGYWNDLFAAMVLNLNGIQIKVDNQNCNNISNFTGKIIDITCTRVLPGRTIEITKDHGLSLCEVEVLQCLTGYYGKRCINSCPKCKDSNCEQWNGTCLSGCAPGYKQQEDKSCAACSYGKFGDRCSKNCQCQNNNDCDKTNGNCGVNGCLEGYMGSNCQKPCSLGTFGKGCLKTCHCKENKHCNNKYGFCKHEGCEKGFKGFYCQEICSSGTFGYGCAQTCHCRNKTNCDNKNGLCVPEGCDAGYTGDNCQESCSSGTFGYGCTQTCHCENRNNCDEKNGSCVPEGCEAGYKGDNCQQSDSTISIPLIIGPSVLLIIIAGIVIGFIVRKSTKKEKNTSLRMPEISSPENIEMDSVVENDDGNTTGPVDDENFYDELTIETMLESTKNNMFS